MCAVFARQRLDQAVVRGSRFLVLDLPTGRVRGAGCGVQGAGFRVQGAGCRVQGVAFIAMEKVPVAVS